MGCFNLITFNTYLQVHSHIIILTWWIRQLDHRSTNNNNKILPQWSATSRTMAASEIFRTSAASELRRFNNNNFSISEQMPLMFEHLRFRTASISQILSLLTVLRVNVITIQTNSNSDNNNLNKSLRTTSQLQLTRHWLERTFRTAQWFYHLVRATITLNLMLLPLVVITKKHNHLERSQASSRTSWVTMEAQLHLHKCLISLWHHLEITTTKCLLQAIPRTGVQCQSKGLTKTSATALKEVPMVHITKRYNWYKLINIKSGKNKLPRGVSNFNLNIYFRE